MSRRFAIAAAATAALAASTIGVAWASGGLDSDAGKAAAAKRAALIDRALDAERKGLANIAARPGKRGPRGFRGPKGPKGSQGAPGAPGPRGLGGVTIVYGPTVTMCDFDASCAVQSSVATCPAGQVVLGGGWDSTSPPIDATVAVNRPVGGSAWGVLMANYFGSPNFRAVATCAPA